MEVLYRIFYSISIIVFLMVLLGGSVTKPFFSGISESTLELAGIQRENVISADDRFDEVFHAVKRVEYQIEKLKHLFSSEEVDKSKYQKEKNYFVQTTFYNPVIEMMNYIYRFGFLFISMFFVLFGLVFHLIYRGQSLRSRVARLEELVMAQQG